MQACDRCYRRKSRCDRGLPACRQCETAKAPCLYTDRTKQPIYRHDYVDKLQRKLRRAEAKIDDLSKRLEVLQKSIAKHSGHALESSLPLPGATSEDDMASGQGATLISPDENSPQVQGPAEASDVIREVSYLSLNAGGERQFLGSTSGVLFADLVRATVEPSSSDTHYQPSVMSEEAISCSGDGWGGREGRGEPLVTQTSKLMEREQESMPQRELAIDLVSAYFSHQHVAYPFLHRSSIFEAVELIYSEPTFYSTHHFEGFVVDMVLAIATSSVNRPDLRMLYGPESHYRRAMYRFYEVLRLKGVRPLQAILLMCQYRAGSSIEDTSASMWHLVGIAARMSLELGLHRESTYRRAVRQHESEADELKLWIDYEIRRRCFWCVFAFDRRVSIVLGRPLALRMEDIDVCFPKTADLSLADHVSRRHNDGIQLCSPTEDGDMQNQNSLAVTGESGAQISIFVHILRYRILCGKIVDTLHASHTAESISELKQSQGALAAQLDEWKRQTQFLRFAEVPLPSSFSSSRSPFLSHDWFELRYHITRVMLYRPASGRIGNSADEGVLQIIYNSARRCIHLYRSLHASQKITYSWITLHSVFMIGLTYIYAVGKYLQKRRQFPNGHDFRLSPEPTPLEIVNDTRICSNVLVALSERWNPSRRCHNVIDRLGNVVVADAISLQNVSNNRREAIQQSTHQPGSPSQVPGPTLMDKTDQLLFPENFFRYPQGPEDDSQSLQLRSNLSLTTDGGFGGFFDFFENLHEQQDVGGFGGFFDFFENLHEQQYVGDTVMQFSQGWPG